MQYWAKVLFGVAVTVALLWWALSGVDFSEMIESIRAADPLLLLAASLVMTSGSLIRAMRWKVLLAVVKADTSLRSRFAAVSIHFMANNILPLRVGEFARAWVFSRLEPVKTSAGFGSLVVERFMDAVVLLMFLVIPVFSYGFPNEAAIFEGWGGLVLRAGVAVVLTVLAALIVMVVFPAFFVAVAERAVPMLPRKIGPPALDALKSFLGSLSVLRDPKLVVQGFAWTFFFWTWHSTAFWFGMRAFGIETGFVSALFTTAFVGFGVALPSAPGFLGTFQVAAVFALSDIYGASEAASLGFGFGFFIVTWIPITCIGLWYVWRLGLSLAEIGRAEERVH